MLYKIYSTLIATPIFILWTVFIATSVSVTALLGLKAIAYHYVPMWWGKFSFWLYLLPVQVEIEEQLNPNQSYIFVANHQGYFDILLMYGYLGRGFKWMMKEYLKKMPAIGAACVFSRQIFVGDSISSIQRAVADARKTLQGGMSMSIFPEGTRSYDGKMISFKRGAFMLAKEIGLPIVPVTIDGSFRAFSRKAKIVTRTPLKLTIHKPISAEYYQSMPTKKFMEEVQGIVGSALED